MKNLICREHSIKLLTIACELDMINVISAADIYTYVSNCAATRIESTFMEIISILFKTKENANYFPEPRLYSFVAAQFETSLPKHGCMLQVATMFGFF